MSVTIRRLLVEKIRETIRKVVLAHHPEADEFTYVEAVKAQEELERWILVNVD